LTLSSYALSAAIVAGFFASTFAKRRVAFICRVALFAILLAQLLIVNGVALGPVGLRLLTALALVVGAIALADTLVFARAWLARANAPLVLDAPFRGKWRVVAGGPLPGYNHHIVARDQYFAYDFIRVGGRSMGSEIVAPVAGTIVVASDGMPDRKRTRNPDHPSIKGRELGNHVAIETPQGCVFLCHLANGSVCVSVGDVVAPGDPIGRCGNSGRTMAPHLHIHAQDEPAYAFDAARGIPIAFRKGGEPKLLRPYSVLSRE
jgi:murein DD-endopeptidase MepM/ murein hydrolase activator NlpD